MFGVLAARECLPTWFIFTLFGREITLFGREITPFQMLVSTVMGGPSAPKRPKTKKMQVPQKSNNFWKSKNLASFGRSRDEGMLSYQATFKQWLKTEKRNIIQNPFECNNWTMEGHPDIRTNLLQAIWIFDASTVCSQPPSLSGVGSSTCQLTSREPEWTVCEHRHLSNDVRSVETSETYALGNTIR